MVRVRDWDDMAAEFGINNLNSIDCEFNFTRKMSKFCGRKVVVEEILLSGAIRFVGGELYGWHISADMLEPIGDTPVAQPDVKDFNSILFSKTPD